MFTQPQRLRRFAVQVLLVWLFALGAGIVHACVVQVQMQHSDAAAAYVHHDAASAVADEVQIADAPGDVHEHDGALTEPPCKRLCDGPSAAPQAEKQPSNPLSGFWLAPAPLPSFSFQPSIATDRLAPSTQVRWRKVIPISIAFLRLAL